MSLVRELCPICNRYKLIESNGLCSQCNKEAMLVTNRLERAYEDNNYRYQLVERVIDRMHLDRYLAIYVISANLCNTPQWREQLAARVCPICEENPATHDSRYCPFCQAYLKAECMRAISDLVPRCSPKAILNVEMITSVKWRSTV
ncbi:MAG: hypothetical protein ACM3NT_03725 [Methylocystaceae bacterium]